MWIPFAGPEPIRALVADVLLTDGVEIINGDLSEVHDGTPVYVLAERDLQDVIDRLLDLDAHVIPVIRGRQVLGFFEVPPPLQIEQASA